MRTLAVIFFVLFFKVIFAQAPSEKLEQLKTIISSINQDVDFNNKLVFVSLWKSTDAVSREFNKEAYRVYKIYENAKLKNGEKGTVFISVNLDEEFQNRQICVNKDGIEPGVVYSNVRLLELLEEFNVRGSQDNIVFDSTGNVQYSNINKDQIFSSIRNLIIR